LTIALHGRQSSRSGGLLQERGRISQMSEKTDLRRRMGERQVRGNLLLEVSGPSELELQIRVHVGHRDPAGDACHQNLAFFGHQLYIPTCRKI
jgi:hypothetical protein